MIETLTALAEPNRLRIVELLREGPRPVGEIGDVLRLRQPQVSKHLRHLKSVGLVAVRPLAQQRVYALEPAPLRAMSAWLEGYRALWEERHSALDSVIEELKQAEQRRD